MALLLIVIFIGFLNHFRIMYFEPTAGADPPTRPVSAWCVVPMWLALVPLLVLGLWWPDAIWHYFGAIAHGLDTGNAVGIALR